MLEIQSNISTDIYAFVERISVDHHVSHDNPWRDIVCVCVCWGVGGGGGGGGM